MTDYLIAWVLAAGWLGMWVARTLDRLGARWPVNCARCFTFWASLGLFAWQGYGANAIALAACASALSYFFDREAV